MFGTFVDEELLGDLAAKASLRKHAPDGALDEFDRELTKHDASATSAETTVVLGDVVVVLLVLATVFAGHFDLGGVDNDDIITGIDVGGVGGLVLAHQDDSDLGSQTAKRDVRGVDDVPILCGIGRSGRGQRGLTLHCFSLLM